MRYKVDNKLQIIRFDSLGLSLPEHSLCIRSMFHCHILYIYLIIYSVVLHVSVVELTIVGVMRFPFPCHLVVLIILVLGERVSTHPGEL